jgi:hypothetical protein
VSCLDLDRVLDRSLYRLCLRCSGGGEGSDGRLDRLEGMLPLAIGRFGGLQGGKVIGSERLSSGCSGICSRALRVTARISRLYFSAADDRFGGLAAWWRSSSFMLWDCIEQAAKLGLFMGGRPNGWNRTSRLNAQVEWTSRVFGECKKDFRYLNRARMHSLPIKSCLKA